MSQDIVEEFRAIPEWPNYEVSNLGRVRSLRRNIGRGLWQEGIKYLKPRLNKKNGRVKAAMVTLRDVVNKRNWQVQISRLVLTVFIGPAPSDKHEACHYPDSSPENNRTDNLRWGEKWENEQHKTDQGMKQRRLRPEEIREAWRRCKSGESQTAVALSLGVDPAAVNRVMNLKSWVHIPREVPT